MGESLSHEAVSLDGLELYRYRFELAPQAAALRPRPGQWRGALGTVLRRMVCHDLTLDCLACPLLTSCEFPALFLPTPPAQVGRLKDPPRPFVVDDSSSSDRRPELGLLLVGARASASLPVVIAALRRLGQEGLGGPTGAFVVEAVRALDRDGMQVDPAVFVRANGVGVTSTRRPLRASDLARRGDSEAARVRVSFRTPTEIRSEGTTAPGAPTFGALLRRTRDRVSALALMYGEPLAFAPGDVATQADAVRMVSADVQSVDASRRSSRTRQVHSLGGVVGAAVYEGAIGPLMPWLRLAELVGVGKHATFGNGRISVDVL